MIGSSPNLLISKFAQFCALLAILCLGLSAQGQNRSTYFRIEQDSLGFVPEVYSDSLVFSARLADLEQMLDSRGYWLRTQRIARRSDTLVWQILRGTRLEGVYTSAEGDLGADLGARLRELEQKGYPFARFEPDSIRVEEGRVRVYGTSIQGPGITLDSIVQKGSYAIPRSWLKHYFGLKTGLAFPYAAVGELELRALKSGLFAFERPAAILYGQEKTSLYLYPRKVASNRLDALVGFNTRSDGATVLNGLIDLKWNDLFHSGEEIRLFWEALPDQVQRLELKFGFPYVFGSPLKLNSDVDFIRQDSSFANVKLRLGLDYLFRDGSWFGLAYTVESSRVPNQESALTAYSKQLFGLRVGKERIDRRFGIPRRGRFSLETLAGSRRTESGAQDQYRLMLHLEHQQPFRLKNAIFSRIEVASMPGAEPLPNEQFRIGGFESLRAVPPLSIFASHYALGTLEYKRLLDRSTVVYALADGLISNETSESVALRAALGLGLSLRLDSSELKLEAVVPVRAGDGADFRATALNIRFQTVF